MNPNFRNFALWVIIFLLVVALVLLFQNPGQRPQTADITFSDLLTQVDQSHVREVTIAGSEITGSLYRRPRLLDLCAERSVAGAEPLQEERADHRQAALRRQ